MLKSTRVTALAAVLVLPLAVVGVIARNIGQAISGPPPRQLLEAPSEWVPFSADVRITKPTSSPVEGRFYRASDGSRRIDTGPSRDKILVSHIVNMAEGVTYTLSQGVWVRRPGSSNPVFRQPPRWTKDLPNWSVHPYKLAIRRGESGSVTASEGFDAFSVVTAGVLHLKVAALNFFDVVVQRPDGWYQAYTDVEIAEQPPDLFSPPSGAVVRDGPPEVQPNP